jgi:hypothetical protein
MAIECGLDAAAVPVSGGNSGECDRAAFACAARRARVEAVSTTSGAVSESSAGQWLRGDCVTNFYAPFDLQRSTISEFGRVLRG